MIWGHCQRGNTDKINPLSQFALFDIIQSFFFILGLENNMVSFFSMIVSQENFKKNDFNLILVMFTEQF